MTVDKGNWDFLFNIDDAEEEDDMLQEARDMLDNLDDEAEVTGITAFVFVLCKNEDIAGTRPHATALGCMSGVI